MIELVFTACLIASPERCAEKHLTFMQPLTPMACLAGAQVQLAQWSEANPKWRIGRWRCQPVRAASRDT